MKFSTELPIMPIKLVLINDYMAHMPDQSNHKTSINELPSFSLSLSQCKKSYPIIFFHHYYDNF